MAILSQPVDTLYTLFLGGSPFVLVTQQVYTIFWQICWIFGL